MRISVSSLAKKSKASVELFRLESKLHLRTAPFSETFRKLSRMAGSRVHLAAPVPVTMTLSVAGLPTVSAKSLSVTVNVPDTSRVEFASSRSAKSLSNGSTTEMIGLTLAPVMVTVISWESLSPAPFVPSLTVTV